MGRSGRIHAKPPMCCCDGGTDDGLISSGLRSSHRDASDQTGISSAMIRSLSIKQVKTFDPQLELSGSEKAWTSPVIESSPECPPSCHILIIHPEINTWHKQFQTVDVGLCKVICVTISEPIVNQNVSHADGPRILTSQHHLCKHKTEHHHKIRASMVMHTWKAQPLEKHPLYEDGAWPAVQHTEHWMTQCREIERERGRPSRSQGNCNELMLCQLEF